MLKLKQKKVEVDSESSVSHSVHIEMNEQMQV